MVGGSRGTWREPTHARGEHANSRQKNPARIQTMNPLAMRQQCSFIINPIKLLDDALSQI